MVSAVLLLMMAISCDSGTDIVRGGLAIKLDAPGQIGRAFKLVGDPVPHADGKVSRITN